MRIKSAKKASATAGIIDVPSVKNTLVSSESKGFDAGKKIKGIKKTIIVGTLGLILAVIIQSASVQDRVGAIDAIKRLRQYFKKVILLFADGGYSGKLEAVVKRRWRMTVQITKNPRLLLLRYCLKDGS